MKTKKRQNREPRERIDRRNFAALFTGALSAPLVKIKAPAGAAREAGYYEKIEE